MGLCWFGLEGGGLCEGVGGWVGVCVGVELVCVVRMGVV